MLDQDAHDEQHRHRNDERDDGSMPNRVARKKLMYIPIITNSPCAKLTIFTTRR